VLAIWHGAVCANKNIRLHVHFQQEKGIELKLNLILKKQIGTQKLT
jgi:hypothetical protein